MHTYTVHADIYNKGKKTPLSHPVFSNSRAKEVRGGLEANVGFLKENILKKKDVMKH